MDQTHKSTLSCPGKVWGVHFDHDGKQCFNGDWHFMVSCYFVSEQGFAQHELSKTGEGNINVLVRCSPISHDLAYITAVTGKEYKSELEPAKGHRISPHRWATGCHFWGVMQWEFREIHGKPFYTAAHCKMSRVNYEQGVMYVKTHTKICVFTKSHTV